MPLNALGSLKASEGKTAEAEKFYRDALAEEPVAASRSPRHNLGLLLAGLKGRQNEAIAVWKQNLAANPDLSGLPLEPGRTARADAAIRPAPSNNTSTWSASKPEYVAARMALAGLYLKSNQADLALDQLRAAARLDTQNASIWEQIGDAEKSLNHADAAREAYATALKLQIEKATASEFVPKWPSNGWRSSTAQILGCARLHAHSSD